MEIVARLQIPWKFASAPGTVRLGARVAALEPGAVRLASGERIVAPQIVVATDGAAAAALFV